MHTILLVAAMENKNGQKWKTAALEIWSSVKTNIGTRWQSVCGLQPAVTVCALPKPMISAYVELVSLQVKQNMVV